MKRQLGGRLRDSTENAKTWKMPASKVNEQNSPEVNREMSKRV